MVKLKLTRIVYNPLFPIVIFLLLILIKFLYGIETSGPTLFFDEFIYIDNARNFLNFKHIENLQYPPIYSLLLIPAVYFSKYWYETTLIINIILSSLIIFPIWLINKKFLSKNFQIISIILAMISPYHISFPGYILAENIFVPLFLLATYLSITSYNQNKYKRLLFGVILGFCYLTKYIFLPSLFIFISIWIIRTIYQEKIKIFSINNFKIILNKILPTLFGFIIILIPWILYACFYLNESITKALGFGISGIKAINSITFSGLILWFTSYLSYTLISIFFFLSTIILFVILVITRKIKLKINETYFVFTSLILSICYVLLATQHSWGATYNYPTPQYLIGRYITHTIPLLIIVSLLGLEKLSKIKINKLLIVVVSILSTFILYLSLKIIFHGQIFTRIIFNSPDTYIYDLTNRSNILILSFIPSVLIFFKDIFKKKYTYLFLIPFFIIQIQLIPKYIKLANHLRSHGIHAKIITPLINQKLIETNTPINFISDNLYFFDEKYKIYFSFRIWGLDKKIINNLKIYEDEINIQKYPTLILSKKTYPLKEIEKYNIKNENYYIYYIDPQSLKNEPEIIDYDPKEIIVNKPFNQQPNGESAMWFKIKNMLPNTLIKIYDEEVYPFYGKDGVITISIDINKYQNNDNLKIQLYNPTFKTESNQIIIPIYN